MDEVKEEVIQIHKTSLSIMSEIPNEIDAGANISLKASVICTAGCSLQGGKVRIIDSQGDVVAEAGLSLSDGTSNQTEEFNVQVPIIPGQYTWTVIFKALEKENILHQECSAEFSFQVKPHSISLSVWGIPLPVSKGEKFSISIGAKCSAGCSLAGLPLNIKDCDGKQVGSGKLGENVLPQTNGVYWTEQELDAPADEAIFKWFIECNGLDLECEHEINPIDFAFRTAAPPEHTVTIEVRNIDDLTPVKEAYVMLGLHKATADDNGIAVLKVPGGEHELYVTKKDYLLFQKMVVITGDDKLKAELVFFPDM
ncbi:MAG: hypothetical protein APF84_06930 [Gracilibacter sp. BRH_c7a]|nr:MAG: hypothetical protein APF84_06930 [Gracilibacter sp. BRH_c7a]